MLLHVFIKVKNMFLCANQCF